MNDRDFLPEDIHTASCGPSSPVEWDLCVRDHRHEADRLIALGWTNPQHPEGQARLARALGAAGDAEGMHYWCKDVDDCGLYSDGRDFAAAIAKAYREDTDADRP